MVDCFVHVLTLDIETVLLNVLRKLCLTGIFVVVVSVRFLHLHLFCVGCRMLRPTVVFMVFFCILHDDTITFVIANLLNVVTMFPH